MAEPPASSRPRNRTIFLFLAVLVVGAVLYSLASGRGGGAASSPAGTSAPAATAEKLRIGALVDHGYSNLLLLAAVKGIFEAKGLDVEIQRLQHSRAALAALREGKVDLAVSGDMPLARKAFGDPDLAIVATIAEEDKQVHVLSRKERGIAAVADLRGKRVGVVDQEISSYVLGLLLGRHGLSLSDVTVVEMKAKKLAPALVADKIDAVADAFLANHGDIRKLRSTPGLEVVEIKEPSGYRFHVGLATSKAVLRDRPAAVTRLLEALVAAADLAKSQRDESAKAVAEALAVEGERVKAEWQRLTYEVALRPTFLATLEDEGKWLAANQPAALGGAAPRYSDIVQTARFEALRPAAAPSPTAAVSR